MRRRRLADTQFGYIQQARTDHPGVSARELADYLQLDRRDVDELRELLDGLRAVVEAYSKTMRAAVEAYSKPSADLTNLFPRVRLPNLAASMPSLNLTNLFPRARLPNMAAHMPSLDLTKLMPVLDLTRLTFAPRLNQFFRPG